MTKRKQQQQIKKVKAKASPQPQLRLTPPPRALSGQVYGLRTQICGLTDPFCDHSIGARYPDDSSVRTLPFRFHRILNPLADANGSSGFLVRPGVGIENFIAGTFVGSVFTPTTPATLQTNPIPTLTDASAFRIVNCGVKLNNVAAPLSASGRVEVRIWAAIPGGSYTSVDVASLQCVHSASVPLQDCKNFAVVIPRTNQLAQTFYTTSTLPSLGEQEAAGFCWMTVAVIGGPASTRALHIEWIQNVEYTFTDDAALALATVPAPVPHPILNKASALVTASANAVFHKTAQVASRWFLTAATKAVTGLLGGRVSTALAIAAAPNVD